MSLHRCPRRGTAHLPHNMRTLLGGGLRTVLCPGEGMCRDHDRPVPCAECAS